MSNSYVTEAEFKNATTGAQWKDLPTSPDELQSYINRASAGIEQFCNRVFAHNAAIVETLTSAGAGRAIIQNSGYVYLKPIQAFPINTVASVTWKLRVPNLANNTPATTAQTVQSGDITVDTDSFGDGYRITVYEDFGAWRDPDIPVLFTVTYDGGYATYPDWLQLACIHWTAGLLKKRGAQAAVMAGSGMVVDASELGGDLRYAMDLLEPHRRRV